MDRPAPWRKPDPLPGPLGNYLRVKKAGPDVAFSFRELTSLVGEYMVVCHDGVGMDPCAAGEPPIKPTPIVMQAAASIGSVPPGAPAWSLLHVGGLTTCPRLLFYKVLATSPCTHVRGPACEPWPHQGLPCP